MLSSSQTRENWALNYDEKAGAESRWHDSFKAKSYVCCQLLEMRKKPVLQSIQIQITWGSC